MKPTLEKYCRILLHAAITSGLVDLPSGAASVDDFTSGELVEMANLLDAIINESRRMEATP